MKIKGLSLRYKLLFALTVIPLVGLALFLMLAVSIFQKDKIAYIFDSSLSVSKTRAARVSSEISSVLSLAQAVVLSYRADTKNLAETGQYYFEKEAKFEAFQLYAMNSETGQYERTVNLVKSTGKEELADKEKILDDLVLEARTKGSVVSKVRSGSKMWLAARFGEATDPKHVVAVILFEASDLEAVFGDRGPYNTFLARKDNAQAIFTSTMEIEPNWGPTAVWGSLSKNKTPEGIAELESPTGKKYLVSFVETGVANLVVVSLVDRQAALHAIDFLIKKSLLFFLAVISATAIIAVLAARGLTGALRHLSSATKKVAEGDFGVRVDIKTGGEIGQLALSFNTMAEEVSRLMLETAEKARMESELATAKTVQETLFPESNAEIGPIHITGHYMPASECGGDWWYYFENENKVYIWIGDATGHGAPAALLTSAARAVASVIDFGPAKSVSESLGILNRAICETSKGKMMMTFFLASIDKSTGLMTYSNASHEAPLLLKSGVTEPSRDDFIPLNDINNPRLGEQPGYQFKEASIQLTLGDRIVFYTDGVVDVKSPDDKTWGERRFLKTLSSVLPNSFENKAALDQVVTQLETFRSSTALDDDVTLILCSYGKAA
jgi:sigma-B regulation protein RsbU (phosphoserine phosphatase)